MAESPWNVLSEADKAQFWASLALKHTQGIGPRSIARLLQHFGSAYAALEQKNFWEEAGVNKDKARLMGAGSWRTTALEEWQQAQLCGAHIILWHHEAYPKLLRSLVDAPAFFYYIGDTSLLSAPCVAIVGSRNCSAEGVQVAGDIARQLSRAGVCVVSGLAQGIDRVAHAASLGHVGRSVGVLGTGIDVIYPKNNTDMYTHLCQEGGVLSEFAPQTGPLSKNFPIRNRIVSGLCLGVLVVEGLPSSGSLITARLALEQNREVYAIPGAATAAISRGCQELIRQGAKPVFNADDILRDLAPQLQEYIPFLNTQESATSLQTFCVDDTFKQAKEVLQAHCEAHVCEEASGRTLRDETQSVVEDTTENFTVAHESISSVKLDNEGFLSEFSAEEREHIRQLLLYLHSHGEVHADILCEALQENIAYVTTLLVEMELAGLVKKLAGARYVAVSTGV